MTHKRIRRKYYGICPRCMGLGYVNTKHGPLTCPYPGCVHGSVEKWLVELVYDDEAEGKQ